MNYLMDQSTMNFAGTAARGSAIGTAVAQGMVSYLNDTNSLEVYKTTGTAVAGWEPVNLAQSPNVVINGGFDIWQRGTTFSNPATIAYLADRWRVNHDGTGATRTVSQQAFTAGTAPVSGYEEAFFMRYAVTAAGSGNTFQDLNHTIEDVRTFAGQTVTLSFWAKADATRSLSLLWRREYNNYAGADQFSMGSALSLTTSWRRYSVTYTVPSLSGITVGINSNVRLIFRMAAATTQTVDIWGVQLEAGQTATPFRRNANSIQGELAACQRYYWRSFGGGSFSAYPSTGHFISSTSYWGQIVPPVPMRITPTVLEYSNIGAARMGLITYAFSSLSIGTQDSGPNAIALFGAVSGAPSGAWASVGNNNSASTGFIALSAEL
jgi:hypothetical protein